MSRDIINKIPYSFQVLYNRTNKINVSIIPSINIALVFILEFVSIKFIIPGIQGGRTCKSYRNLDNRLPENVT